MIRDCGERRPATRLRLTMASELGRDIDGAWWLRTARTARELPELITTLQGRLGEIVDINVTPLVDVCLVLVIIFMVVSPFAIQSGIQVLQTKAKAAVGKVADSEDRGSEARATQLAARLQHAVVHSSHPQSSGPRCLVASSSIQSSSTWTMCFLRPWTFLGGPAL